MRLALFEPDIPQNLGAFIRLSACLGVPLDIIEPCGFPVDDKRIRRAAMDYSTWRRIARHASWAAFRRDRPRRPAGPADHQGRDATFPTSPSEPTTSCCSAARAPACRTRCTRRPTSGCASRCSGRALAQCRAGRRHGSERGPAPDLGIRCALRLDTPTTAARRRHRAAPQGRGARLVREPARPHLRRVRALEDELAGTHRELRARPLRAQGLAARGRARRRGSRRRRHGAHARPRVREGRRQRLDRVRRVQPGVPQADPGRRRGPRF